MSARPTAAATPGSVLSVVAATAPTAVLPVVTQDTGTVAVSDSTTTAINSERPTAVLDSVLTTVT